MLMPLITQFGWDPVWFGVVITVNLAICTITPPIAVNLYVASNISGASMEEVSAWVLPFFIALMAVLILVILFRPEGVLPEKKYVPRSPRAE